MMLINNQITNLKPMFNAKISAKNVKKLVPLNDFKGPVLELTPEEKELVAKYEKEIATLEGELYLLDKYHMIHDFGINQRDYVNRTFGKVKYKIEVLKNKIKEIKTNRYKQQLAEFNK